MHVLVVLVECEGSEAVIPAAQKHAAAGAKVTVLQVFDPQYTEKLCRKLRQDGWMGASKSVEVSQAIATEYRQRFDAATEAVIDALRSDGLEVERVVRSGDLVNTTLRLAEASGDVGMILVAQPKRSWLARWFSDLNVRVLIDKAPCEVQLVQLQS